MFQVVTVNLAHDTSAAGLAHGAIDVGELTAEEFTALLERFRLLDPVQIHETDPQLLVTARAGKFRIRTGQGKLILDTPRDTSKSFAELTPEEIVLKLDQPSLTSARFDRPDAFSRKASVVPNRAIAATILAAGLALNGYTLYSVFYTETVDEKPAVAPVTDAAALTAQQNAVHGTYITGEQPGDRTITIEATGKIKFAEVGARSGYNTNADTFRIGRLGKNYCLVTVDSGIVEILNLDTLVYYRDTYKRLK